jgi:hypothetical protein
MTGQAAATRTHVHTVWRDPAGDFGRDLLARHYARHHSPGPAPHRPPRNLATTGEHMPTSTQSRPTRPAGVPAYYLGRPAGLWLTALRHVRPPQADLPASRTTTAPETQ